MPIYEYKCTVCEITIEVEKSIHEESQPMCCGLNMSRSYSTFGITFKGKGWGHQ